jgi:hypothetical protein
MRRHNDGHCFLTAGGPKASSSGSSLPESRTLPVSLAFRARVWSFGKAHVLRPPSRVMDRLSRPSTLPPHRRDDGPRTRMQIWHGTERHSECLDLPLRRAPDSLRSRLARLWFCRVIEREVATKTSRKKPRRTLPPSTSPQPS